MPYDVPNYFVDFAMRNTHVPVGVWRSVNHSQNAFFKECFIDELAHAAGADPYQYRRKLLAQGAAPPRGARCRRREGRMDHARASRHLARNRASRSRRAASARMWSRHRWRPAASVRVHRVVSAIDAGHVVNPLSVELQTESAVVYGLTAALYGEITIKDGQVEQSNFSDYQMLRMAEMPRIETIIVPSSGTWGGVGEPPLPPLAPALCNAIFAATGQAHPLVAVEESRFEKSLRTGDNNRGGDLREVLRHDHSARHHRGCIRRFADRPRHGGGPG